MIFIDYWLAADNCLNCPVKQKRLNRKYLKITQRCQVIKYSMRETAQFVVVQPSAIYFTVVILNTQRIGYGNTFRFAWLGMGNEVENFY